MRRCGALRRSAFTICLSRGGRSVRDISEPVPKSLPGHVKPVAGLDSVAQTRCASPVWSRSRPDTADPFHCPLRAQVRWTNQEDDSVDEPKSVTQHEPLEFPVIGATPVRAREKSPADFDLAPVGIVAVVSGRADQTAVCWYPVRGIL